MNDQLAVAAHFILKATRPEDIFGKLDGATPEAQLKSLTKVAHLLLRQVHPDKFQDGDRQAANRVAQIVTEMRLRAEAAINRGTYGSPAPGVILQGRYHCYGGAWAGDIADLHPAYFHDDARLHEAVVKIARNPEDNPYLKREADCLRDLHRALKGRKIDFCIPQVYDTLQVTIGSKRHSGVVLERCEGWYDVRTILTLVPSVDGRTLVWMWKRLLTLLSRVHRAGYLHGALLPPHIMYIPDNRPNGPDESTHGIRVVDWCYAVKDTESKLSIWCPKYREFYAPEVLKKYTLGPWTDLYMGAKVMLALAGGSVTDKKFPAAIPEPIAKAITKCLHENHGLRPRTAGEHFEDFQKAALSAYETKFHAFNLPVAAPSA
jgi:hypothetical protein